MGVLADSRAHIRQVAELAGDMPVIVMLSGGKDSVITLHLVREVFPAERVKCVHLGMCKGLRFIESVLDQVCKRYSVTWHWYPHVLAAAYMRDARYRKPNLAEVQQLSKRLVYRDIEAHARKELGAEWVFDGQRKADSLERRGMIKQWGIVDEQHKRAHPIADWSAKSAWAYAAAKKLPTVPWLDTTARNGSGLDFKPETLAALCDRYPDDYATLERAYPFIGGIIARQEMFGK
jgi:3'-phosphoadenosine 5'-phosphosulfate sulfotransferase (PAPS reductase)/FAD synthetase